MQKKIFISYSHKDEEWKDLLVAHLGVLENIEILDIWDDRKITAGEKWLPSIENALNKASAAIMIISAYYLSSDFIKKKEIESLLERRAKEGMRIFPLILSACAWNLLDWLNEIQVRPPDGKPLMSFKKSEIDKYLTEFAIELHKILNKPCIKSSSPSKFTQKSEPHDQFDDEPEEENILPHRRLITGTLIGMLSGLFYGLLFGRFFIDYLNQTTSIIFNGISGTFIGAATGQDREMHNYSGPGIFLGMLLWIFLDFGISGENSAFGPRAIIYGAALGGIIGVIIKWTRNIVKKIKTKDSETVQLLIEISPNLKKILKRLARQKEKTSPQMIREILENYVKNTNRISNK